MPVGLTTMDRILLAIIASAVLLLLGAASLYVTNTADLMNTPARSGRACDRPERPRYHPQTAGVSRGAL